MQQETLKNWHLFILFLICILAVFAGMFNDVLDVDAAQYANMSREMAESMDFLHLKNRGNDYLDKPPLIFWIVSLFYKLFGVSNFVYRLPSVIFSALAVYSTFRFTKILKGRQIALYAALILASTQAFFLMNQDVKTDMYLIGAVMFTIWQLTAFSKTGKLLNVLGAFSGMAIGMLAKGPLGIIIPVLAFGSDLLLRREWKLLFNIKWLAGIPVLVIILFPFSYGLYEQFGWDGVKFFYWTQSFGRITSESEWANDASVFYFIHTFAWAFIPWTLLFIPAFIRSLVEIGKQKFNLHSEQSAIAISGFLLTFLALSLSKFKLPHYIFIVAPFAAYLTAEWIARTELKWVAIFQYCLIGSIVIAATILSRYAFNNSSLFFYLIGVAIVLVALLSFFHFKQNPIRIILPSFLLICGFNFILNSTVFPEINKYQSSAVSSKYARAQGIPSENYYTYIQGGYTADFYYRHLILMPPSPESVSEESGKRPVFIYTNEEGLQWIKQLENRGYEIVKKFEHKNPSKLNLMFLNPATREQSIENRYLIRVYSGKNE